GARAAAGVGVEDFEEVAEGFLFRFEAEFLVRGERYVIRVQIIVRRNRIKPQVRAGGPLLRRRARLAGLNLIDRAGPKRPARLFGINAARLKVNVGRVVSADGGGDGRLVEQPLADGEQLAGRAAHEHDVDQALAG